MHFPHHPIANSNSSTGRCCARCSSTSLDNDDTLSLPERATSTGTNRGMHSIRCTKLQELTVQGAGIDEIKAHISKCPLSPRSMDRFGRSPLFWAIKLARSDEIIRHVYLAAPDMLLSFDVYGKTCLDLLYAPRTRNARVLRWLFAHDPSLAVSKSPSPFIMPLLHRICIRWSLSSHFDSVDMEIVLVTIDAAHRQSYCRCHVPEQYLTDCVPVLHMAMELGLPSLVLSKLVRYFPQDLCPCPTVSPVVPLHFFLAHYSPTDDGHAIAFLRHMLQVDDSGSANAWIQSINGVVGTKPLHCAIRQGFAWKSLEALRALIEAAPGVLHEADQATQLLPFQLAACTPCFADETVQLDAIYTLLRAQPTVLRHP